MVDEQNVDDMLRGEKWVQILKDNQVVGYFYNSDSNSRIVLIHEDQPDNEVLCQGTISNYIAGITKWMNTHGYTFGKEGKPVIAERC